MNLPGMRIFITGINAMVQIPAMELEKTLLLS